MPEVYVLNKFQPNPYSGIEIDTTSRGGNRDLSPFFLGPVLTYEPGVYAANMENLWQYCKVYPDHVVSPPDRLAARNAFCYQPSDEYYKWRNAGWANRRAVRYPMGKGAKPLYSLWAGRKLGYVEARKQIYVPLYGIHVAATKSYEMLYKLFIEQGRNIILRDFDGYDYIAQGKTLVEVINDPTKTAGHAFILAAMLKGQFRECLDL